MARRRLGWLGPIIVLVGIVAAGAASWYMVSAKPKAGAVIDTLAIDATSAIVVRAEDGGDRNFIELQRDGAVVWQAMVPPYAGRPGAPGIAWSPIAVSVRVIRDDRAEVFAIAMRDASKLGGFRLAPEHGKMIKATVGPVTLTDHVRSYELVSGAGWNQLVGIDLGSGEALWKQELGSAAVLEGGVEDGSVWIRQGATRRAFRAADGKETSSPSSS